MSVPVAWKTNEPFCGANDPLGREDTANKYLRGLYTLYRVNHHDSGIHKSVALSGIPFTRQESWSYVGTGVKQTIALQNVNLKISIINVVGDVTQQPVIGGIGDRDTFQVYDARSADHAIVGYDYAEFGGDLYLLSGYSYDNNDRGVFVYDGNSWNTSKMFSVDLVSLYGLAVFNSELFMAQTDFSAATWQIWGFNGTTWTLRSSGSNRMVQSLVAWNGYLYAGNYTTSGGSFVSARIMRSTNGISWTDVLTVLPTPYYYVSSFCEFGSKLYAVLSSSSDLKIYETSDGINWTESYSVTASSTSGLIFPKVVYGGKLYIVDNAYSSQPRAGNIYRYDGSSWETLSLKTLLGASSVYVSLNQKIPIINGELVLSGTVDGAHGYISFDGISWRFDSVWTVWSLIIPYNGDVYLAQPYGNIYQKGLLSKVFGTAEMQPNHVIETFQTGEFVVGTDDAVNKSGETYYYTAYGVEE